jgi:PAS domain S-box-containing protein
VTAGTVPEAEVLGRSFAKAPHPMWIFDQETLAFLDVNYAAVQHYGYSRQQFLTMTILQIRPPADVPKLFAQTAHPDLKGQSTAEQWRHQAKDGTVFPVTITSWELTFRGRSAELVLARRADPTNPTEVGKAKR